MACHACLFFQTHSTKVKDGRVQKKNRSRPTGHEGYVLGRESPGRSFRHVVSKRDVQAFVELIPDWLGFSQRLERIVLAKGDDGDGWRYSDGWYQFYRREESGVIYLCSWRDDLWIELTPGYFDAHQPIFEKLGVSYDRDQA